MLGTLPAHSQAQKRLMDGFNAHHTLGEALLEVGVCRYNKGPDARLFSRDVRRFVQDGTQGFTCGRIKLSLHRFWSGRLLLEAIDALLRVSMDGIAHGLRGTAQIRRADFRALSSTGS